MRRLFAISGAFGLSVLTGACSTVPVVPLPPGPAPQVCNARAVSWAIGERARADVLEEATLDAGARTARVIRPGDIVTMEFSAERLTIEVDGRNRIVDVRCG
jgi:hypothetical protein